MTSFISDSYCRNDLNTAQTPPGLIQRDTVSNYSEEAPISWAMAKISLTPAEELPDEIISQIFLYSVSDTIDISLESFQYPSEPWNLACVCWRWRRITLDTPALWNNISFSLLSTTEEDYQSLLRVLKIVLARTGNSLVSLQVLSHEMSGTIIKFEKSDQFCLSLVSMLSPYVARIRHLSVRPLEMFSPLLAMPGIAMISLESLSLSFARVAVTFYGSTIACTQHYHL
jgi:F-box-like